MLILRMLARWCTKLHIRVYAEQAVQEPQASPTSRLPLPAGPDHFPHADAQARKAAPAAKAAPQAAKGAAQAGGGRAGGAPGTARRGAAAKAPAGESMCWRAAGVRCAVVRCCARAYGPTVPFSSMRVR